MALVAQKNHKINNDYFHLRTNSGVTWVSSVCTILQIVQNTITYLFYNSV